VLIEAGPKLVNAFLDTGLVDEVIEYKSSEPLGEKGVSWLKKNTTIENLGFKLESTCKIKSDIKNIYRK
jgi:riboflavin biosynthesis pyrimidine reductase